VRGGVTLPNVVADMPGTAFSLDGAVLRLDGGTVDAALAFGGPLGRSGSVDVKGTRVTATEVTHAGSPTRITTSGGAVLTGAVDPRSSVQAQ
jgi:hypothetical protein